MSAALYDMVKMTVTGTPGTGSFTLNAAVAGFQSFAGAGVPDQTTVTYAAAEASGAPWEFDRGVYSVSGTSLSRVTRLRSSSGGAISFTSGAIIRILVLAEDLQPAPASGLTANANNLQSTTAIIAANHNFFTTVTATNNSCKIPASMMIPGCFAIYIKNNGVNQLNLFGDSGVTINNLAANASWPIEIGATAQIIIESSTLMHTVP